jgi:hypothetical protein
MKKIIFSLMLILTCLIKLEATPSPPIQARYVSVIIEWNTNVPEAVLQIDAYLTDQLGLSTQTTYAAVSDGYTVVESYCYGDVDVTVDIGSILSEHTIWGGGWGYVVDPYPWGYVDIYLEEDH